MERLLQAKPYASVRVLSPEEQKRLLEAVDLDGIFVLAPMTPIVPELAREIEKARLEAGLRIDELLRSLRDKRESYHAGPAADKPA